jgi:hypothetical protein
MSPLLFAAGVIGCGARSAEERGDDAMRAQWRPADGAFTEAGERAAARIGARPRGAAELEANR